MSTKAKTTSFKRTAKQETPHAIYTAGEWEWRVLKAYKNGKGTASDPYARFFCAVRSPYTYGGFELGDVYAKEVLAQHLKECSPGWAEEYHR